MRWVIINEVKARGKAAGPKAERWRGRETLKDIMEIQLLLSHEGTHLSGRRTRTASVLTHPASRVLGPGPARRAGLRRWQSEGRTRCEAAGKIHTNREDKKRGFAAGFEGGRWADGLDIDMKKSVASKRTQTFLF